MNITAKNMTYEELKALLQYVETLENKEDYEFSLSAYKACDFKTDINVTDLNFESFAQAMNDNAVASKD